MGALEELLGVIREAGASSRPAQYSSEAAFFKSRPDVPAFHQGMEAVYNPYHPQGQATIPNELLRMLLSNTASGQMATGTTEITPRQRQFFQRGPRSETTDDEIAATIIARILTGDQSLAPYTGGQAYRASEFATTPRDLLRQQLLQRR